MDIADKNKEKGIFLPGLKPVLELLEREPERVDQVFVRNGHPGREADQILNVCRRAGVHFVLVPEQALARVAPGAQHQGVVARLRETPRADWPTLLAQAQHAPLPLLVALDQVQDPGNVGTLARTLYSLGAAGLVLPKHNSAFLGPGARRAAAGALELLPVAEVTNLIHAINDASEAGFAVYAAQRRGESALTFTPRFPALLVLGNEDKGIRPGVAKHCEYNLSIPFLRDFDSLNVAQAGGILTSCFLRGNLPSGN